MRIWSERFSFAQFLQNVYSRVSYESTQYGSSLACFLTAVITLFFSENYVPVLKHFFTSNVL